MIFKKGIAKTEKILYTLIVIGFIGPVAQLVRAHA